MLIPDVATGTMQVLSIHLLSYDIVLYAVLIAVAALMAA